MTPTGDPATAPVPVDKLSYTEASRELDAIVDFFEQREVDVDVLVVRLERATELIDELDRRLRHTRAQVEELVPRLESLLPRSPPDRPATNEEDEDPPVTDAATTDRVYFKQLLEAAFRPRRHDGPPGWSIRLPHRRSLDGGGGGRGPGARRAGPPRHRRGRRHAPRRRLRHPLPPRPPGRGDGHGRSRASASCSRRCRCRSTCSPTRSPGSSVHDRRRRDDLVGHHSGDVIRAVARLTSNSSTPPATPPGASASWWTAARRRRHVVPRGLWADHLPGSTRWRCTSRSTLVWPECSTTPFSSRATCTRPEFPLQSMGETRKWNYVSASHLQEWMAMFGG